MKKYIVSLIALAPNLFYGTSINITIIMVLSKSKIMMIDVSNLFEKDTNQK